jgi:methionyl-tRNA synthetase
MAKQKIVVTAALPSANGLAHIGHLLEYIQADIYSRFLKSLDKDALYICASDMHGTPIEVNAKKAGQEPKQFAEKFSKEYKKDFASYLINFDNYYHTDSKENKELAEHFFNELKKKKLIYTKKMNVIYCNDCNRSLPDRYVRGTCPHCTTAEQYGDVCESCGIILKGTDLVNPKCSLCGKTPLQKESEHYFFKLSSFSDKLKKWIKNPKSELQPEIKNWLNTWIKKGLDDWCISRDEPYYGFEIPDSKKETGEKKFFYVWLDAPIGYISSTKNYCNRKKLNWKDYWFEGKVHHFIGKDIVYFHFLFWPAMLMAMGIPLPKLTVHGFVNVNGKKMSKSRGTFFTAKDFLKLYPAESLRFYYARGLDKKVVDLDINFEDFKAVINHVLVGNLGNFCYRTLVFAEKNYGGISAVADEKKLIKELNGLFKVVEEKYQKQDFKIAVKTILQIADLGNQYFQKSEVWKDKDSDLSKQKVGFCVNLAKNLAIIVNPILPDFSQKIYLALGEKNLLWKDLNFSWQGKLKKVELLVEKIETVPESARFPLQLVVGEIKEVKDHPNADSLYLLTVNLGKKIGIKQVVAGLKKEMLIKELLGRKVVFCVNMKPAKLRGEKSEAMVLAADDTDTVALLDVDKTKVGEEVAFAGMENNSAEITFDDFKKVNLNVKDGKVVYNDKVLSSKVEDVTVAGVKEGSRVS